MPSQKASCANLPSSWKNVIGQQHPIRVLELNVVTTCRHLLPVFWSWLYLFILIFFLKFQQFLPTIVHLLGSFPRKSISFIGCECFMWSIFLRNAHDFRIIVIYFSLIYLISLKDESAMLRRVLHIPHFCCAFDSQSQYLRMKLYVECLRTTQRV